MQQTPSTFKAALWMAGWLALMVTMAVAGRETLREVNVFQIMELRSIIGLIMLLPMIRAAGGLRALRSQRPGQHVTRNLVHYAGQISWFYALTLIPLGQVVAIEFTMPIWIVVLAAVFLGERLTAARALAVALGLIGVVLIVKPTTAINPGQLFALAAAVTFAVSITLMKSLTRTDSSLTIIVWMLAIQAVCGLAPTIYVWRDPSAWAWVLIVVIAFCGTFSHYCMARAMTYADATVVVPMDFLRVPLSALAGWLFYAERLDALAVLGAALILSGNFANLRSATPRPAE